MANNKTCFHPDTHVISPVLSLKCLPASVFPFLAIPPSIIPTRPNTSNSIPARPPKADPRKRPEKSFFHCKGKDSPSGESV